MVNAHRKAKRIHHESIVKKCQKLKRSRTSLTIYSKQLTCLQFQNHHKQKTQLNFHVQNQTTQFALKKLQNSKPLSNSSTFNLKVVVSMLLFIISWWVPTIVSGIFLVFQPFFAPFFGCPAPWSSRPGRSWPWPRPRRCPRPAARRWPLPSPSTRRPRSGSSWGKLGWQFGGFEMEKSMFLIDVFWWFLMLDGCLTWPICWWPSFLDVSGFLTLFCRFVDIICCGLCWHFLVVGMIFGHDPFVGFSQVFLGFLWIVWHHFCGDIFLGMICVLFLQLLSWPFVGCCFFLVLRGLGNFAFWVCSFWRRGWGIIVSSFQTGWRT